MIVWGPDLAGEKAPSRVNNFDVKQSLVTPPPDLAILLISSAVLPDPICTVVRLFRSVQLNVKFAVTSGPPVSLHGERVSECKTVCAVHFWICLDGIYKQM